MNGDYATPEIRGTLRSKSLLPQIICQDENLRRTCSDNDVIRINSDRDSNRVEARWPSLKHNVDKPSPRSSINSGASYEHMRASISTSSLESHYVNKIFSITCIVIMVACFGTVVFFAVLAAYRDVQAAYVEKNPNNHKPVFPQLPQTVETGCSLQVTESIPSILKYPTDAIRFPSTFDSWQQILSAASSNNTSSISRQINIASAYWSMMSSDVSPYDQYKPDAAEGELVFEELKEICKEPNSKMTVVNSYPKGNFKNNDTEILRNLGADVSLVKTLSRD